MLNIDSETDDGILILNSSGRIDGGTAREYENTLIERIFGGHSRILLNCEAVEYVSSAGLRVLLMASRRAEEAGGKLVLCAVRDPVHDVFKYSGFADVISIYADREQALESF